MSAEVLLWLMLGVFSLVAIGLGLSLLRSRKHTGTSPPPAQHHAYPQNPQAAARGPETRRAVQPEAPRAASSGHGRDAAQSGEYGTGYTLFNMSPEERARLLAAASNRRPTVTAQVPQQPQQPSTPQPPPLTPRAAIAGRHEAPTGLIRGYVRDSGGAVIAGASLTLIDLAGGQIGRGVTGNDGGYSLLTPGSGSYFLIARARGHHPQASTVTVSDQPLTVRITLTGLAELSGVVHVAGGQEPVSDALVTLLDLRGEVVASTTSDMDGRYRFTELVGGSYTLAASASPFQPTARLITVSESGSSGEDLELFAGAYLRGTARGGRQQRVVPDARVVLEDEEGNVVATTRTDAAGEYLFSDVPEGNYTVSASGYPPVSASLRVYSGQKHEHDVELRHPDD